MSNNPFTQEPILSQEEFRLLEEVEYWLGFNLTRPEILAQAKFYADAMGVEISQAYKVMLKGSDKDEVMLGDEYWKWAKAEREKPKVYGGHHIMVPHYFYGWCIEVKSIEEDPCDDKPSDFPEYHFL